MPDSKTPPDPREPLDAAALRRGARRIAVMYALCGSAWILGSDWLLGQLVHDPSWWTRLAIVKGWLFIALSATLLYLLVRARAPWVLWRPAPAAAEALGGLALMRAIADGSTDAIFAKDLSGRYILCNREAARVLGKPIDAVIGSDDTHLFPPDDAAAVMANDRSVVAGGRVETLEEVLNTSDGIVTYLATKGPLRGAGDRIIGTFGISRDITARKRAETALQDSEATQRTLLAAMADGMFVAQDHRFVFANAALPRLLGHDDAGFVGLAFDAVVAPEHLALWTERFERRVGPDEEPPRHYEVAFLRKDGSRLWMDLRASRMPYRGRPAVLGLVRDVTERKAAECALREAHELVQAVEDSILDHMAVLDRDGMIVAVNAAWSRFAQDNAGAVRPAPRTGVGTSYLEVLATADGPSAEGALEAREGILAVLRGEREHFRMEYACPSELESRWFQMSVTPLRTAHSGAVVVHADISARRLAEDQLRKLSLAVEQCPLGIVIADTSGCVEYVNAAFSRLTGWRADEAIGRLREELSSPSASAAEADGVHRALASGATWDGTRDHVRRDGTPYRVFVHAAPIRQAAGRITHQLAIFEDITERDRIRAELERHRNRLEQLVAERTQQLEGLNRELVEREHFIRTIADNQPCLLAYWDLDMRCRFANRAYREWFGKSEQQIIGIRYEDLMPVSRVGDNRAYLDGVRRGEAQRFQRLIGSPSGATMHSMVSYIPDVVDGRQRGFLALALDVDEMKRAELELQRVNAALVESRDSAEAANRAKTAFLANMSHEIRTPMNAIIGLGYLLRRDSRDPVALDRLGKLSEAGNHLLQLIDDILDLSKIEAGRLELEKTDFSFTEVLRRCRGLVTQRADEKGLVLQVEARGVPDALHGDPTRLSQALLNLMSNAVKFTEAGQVTVEAGVVSRDERSVLVRLCVRDTGIGIETDKLGGLFQAFAQADTSTTRRFGGTGLGLAITQRLAEMMDGEIGVSSRPGIGSEFWFTARLALAAQPLALPSDDLRDAEDELRRRSAGLRVLVVEDNPINQELARALLGAVGLRVATCASGLEALAQVARSHFDAVLMDIQMPDMDGLEAARRIRAGADNAEVPIIALTASTLGGDRVACERAGMDECLAKPIEPRRLYECLLRWLPGGATAAAVHAPAVRAAGPSALELDHLETLLQAGDFGADAAYRFIRSMMHDHFGADLAEFESALLAFEHDRALAVLRRLRAEE